MFGFLLLLNLLNLCLILLKSHDLLSHTCRFTRSRLHGSLPICVSPNGNLGPGLGLSGRLVTAAIVGLAVGDDGFGASSPFLAGVANFLVFVVAERDAAVTFAEDATGALIDADVTFVAVAKVDIAVNDASAFGRVSNHAPCFEDKVSYSLCRTAESVRRIRCRALGEFHQTRRQIGALEFLRQDHGSWRGRRERSWKET